MMEHILTSVTFKNCGARQADNHYDTDNPARGCDPDSDDHGCASDATVWGFVTHSDQHTPEIMQATRNVTYEDCGRRFRMHDFTNDLEERGISAQA